MTTQTKPTEATTMAWLAVSLAIYVAAAFLPDILGSLDFWSVLGMAALLLLSGCLAAIGLVSACRAPQSAVWAAAAIAVILGVSFCGYRLAGYMAAVPQALQTRVTHDMPWALDLSRWQPPEGVQPPFLVEKLQQQLADPAGWTRTGIRFVPVASPDDAAVVITLVSAADINDTCNYPDTALNLKGCAVAVLPGVCEISLVYTAVQPGAYEGASLGTVNHEIGHCFGLPHADKGLMYPFNSDNRSPYPSEAQVAAVRDRLLG